MHPHLDQAVAIRKGEELPLDRLQTYLREHLPDLAGPLTIEQFAQGHSNLTYLLHVGPTELVLRRPPFGNQVKTAHDMGREYRVLSALHSIYPPAPRPYLYCAEEGVLGSPFYIMERRQGIVLRRKLPADLTIDGPSARRLDLALIDNLATLHGLDYQAVGLGDLGKPEGYVTRQVHGWIKRYHEAKTHELPVLDQVTGWLTKNLPEEAGAALIHNDYKFDNLLLDPADFTRIVAVLDWKMATIGDPLMDFGTTLAYWIEPTDPELLRQLATGPTYLPGSLTRRELIDRYQEKTGRQLTQVLFYYCYGLFKLVGILQQIYVRYVRGHTQDARFARLNEHVAILADQAGRALERGRV